MSQPNKERTGTSVTLAPPFKPIAEFAWDRLRKLNLRDFTSLRILVAGDFMLDEYVWGRVGRISPEAPVMVVNVERETRMLGGAGNVVNNLRALGAQVEVLGLVGGDKSATLLRQELKTLGVSCKGLFSDVSRVTTRKTRIIGGHQQVVRIDRETDKSAPPAFADKALKHLHRCLPHLDAIIFSDYAKGALTPTLVQEIIRLGQERCLPMVVDSKSQDVSPYAGATVITPNQNELKRLTGQEADRQETLVQLSRGLRERLSFTALLITQGAGGMTLIQEDGALHIPARTPREVFDVSGAGDTVIAALTLGLVSWKDLPLAATLANLAAGVVVTKRGTAPILINELERELQGYVHQNEKIIPIDSLNFIINNLKALGKKVVFTNGCFDLLHVGHIKFLERSKGLGDVLVVALDSDDSVYRVKGEGRPVTAEQQRLQLLAALSVVDYVTIFDTEQLPEILNRLKPDILTKGSNYPENKVAGRGIVQSYGGSVKTIPIEDPISSIDLINRIRQKKY
jgi:D-beta-D-heptose 7-phosphate kinase/D-beta-D-heptose 1-phosphate adenosyltransferase